MSRSFNAINLKFIENDSWAKKNSSSSSFFSLFLSKSNENTLKDKLFYFVIKPKLERHENMLNKYNFSN